jgi:hypothetical protein
MHVINKNPVIDNRYLCTIGLHNLVNGGVAGFTTADAAVYIAGEWLETE